jgi:hypothetical protein
MMKIISHILGVWAIFSLTGCSDAQRFMGLLNPSTGYTDSVTGNLIARPRENSNEDSEDGI